MASSPKKEKTAIRKRGPNYTEAEKQMLRSLAKKYNNVIESKSTSTLIFKQKSDAWMQLAKSYNASSTSGMRTPEQLKHLYENMKQNARKALATSNKAEFLHKLEEEKERADVLVAGTVYKSDKDEDIMDLDTLKVLDQADKIQRKKTGGGSCTPAIQDKDLKVLELIKDQVEPLSNPFDSAASYFNDDLIQEQPFGEIRPECTTDLLSRGEHMVADEFVETVYGERILSSKEKWKETQSRTGMLSASLKKTISYKNAYFKKKYENSILERRCLYQEIRLRQKEHLLRQKEHLSLMKKLKLEIEIMEKQQ